MESTPRLSVIVSTFDRPDALARALAAIRGAGAGLDLEVVVADDGSGPATGEAVERFRSSAPFPVLHARQDHDGFRLAAARNGAIRAARGEILVFLDGDCLLFPGTLREHAGRVRPGLAHTGARVLLDPGETADLLEGRATFEGTASSARRRALAGLFRLRAANAFYRTLRLKLRPKLAAANCAVHRRDLEAVNGFDERFIGWGFEDDDLARRLRRSGAEIADGTLRCLALHLFHPVHESHRPDSRRTPNAVYYRTGRFLANCRRGLRARSLEEIRFVAAGTAPPAVERFVEDLVGRSGEGPAHPEVVLTFPGARDRKAGMRGEMEIAVPPEACASEAALREFLERSI